MKPRESCAGDPRLVARRNVNRGYRKMRAWIRAIDLYALVVSRVNDIPGRPYALQNQITAAASSVHSNIAEGYGRRTLKEYLQFLNFALASCGEVYSRCYACVAAGQLKPDTFDQIGELHFEVENLLLALIASLQKKQLEGHWEDNLAFRESGQRQPEPRVPTTPSNLPTFHPSEASTRSEEACK